MTVNHSHVAISLVMIVLLVSVSEPVRAQSSSELSWQPQAESRLKAIYEQGVFRSKKFQAEWRADSTGFTWQETDPQSNKLIETFYDVRSGKRTESTAGQGGQAKRGAMLAPDGKRVLEFQEGNLFVRDVPTGQQTQLTKRPNDREVSYRSPAWSPDGRRVLFIESDSTDVRQRAVLIPDDPSYPSIKQNRFARVGEKLEALRVGVAEIGKETIDWLPIDSPSSGFYLGQVEWAANSDEVLVEMLSRFRDQRDFLLISVGGASQRIFHETDEAWVVESQGKNAGLRWLRDGKEFVMVSEKDGWRHAYRVSRSGKELANLTPGDYDLIDRATIDEEGGWYYFYASPQDGTQKVLYRVPLDGSGKLERITPEDQTGTHTYDFSPDSKWAIHTFSTMDSPPVVELVEMPAHRVVCVLEEHSTIRAKLKELQTHPTEFLQLDIGSGVSMDAWMIKPRDFDPTKKYPIFIYVYGEPYAQTVLNEWGAAQIDFHRVVADLGYLVVSIDNRGTPAPKGAAWRRSIFGSLGPLSTEDQEAGLKALAKTRPYVDLSRVGIWGWSGGGSNTLNALFRKPKSYHVGIAVVPKPQPHLYNAWFQEIYMRTREVNPEGYERAAAINYAAGLEGKLLMITGSGETNTHIQIIEGLVDKLIELGKPFDYMVYPNRDHGLREGSGTTVHVRMLILRYLLDNLPAGAR